MLTNTLFVVNWIDIRGAKVLRSHLPCRLLLPLNVPLIRALLLPPEDMLSWGLLHPRKTLQPVLPLPLDLKAVLSRVRLFLLRRLSIPLMEFSDGASNISIRHINLTAGRATAIDARLADNVKIESIEVGHFGLHGVQLGPNSTLFGTNFHDLGGYGANMFGDGEPATLTPGNSHIINSRFQDWAQWQRVYTPAVVLGGVANSVRH